MSAAVKKDFTEGPLFGRMLLFTVPIMLTGLLQLLYNAADHIVVGRFSDNPNALAAVGSTSSLSNLIINLLIGISIGSSIVVAQNIGAKRYGEVEKSVHTSIAISFIGGIIFALIGLAVTKPMLVLMGTNSAILDDAALYIRIICIGIPATSVFNFGAKIFCAGGKSDTPLIVLSISGAMNVILNVFFVVVLGMDVDGVALATIISQYISATMILALLCKTNECYKFSFKKLRIDLYSLKKVLLLGIPSGVQSSLFSVSNITIQSAVNTFPLETISGNTISSTIEGFSYTVMNSFSQTAVTFAGQNYGAKKPQRLKNILIIGLAQVLFVGLVFSMLEYAFVEQLAALFVNPSQGNPAKVIAAAALRGSVILTTYFLCGLMDVLAGFMRGIGRIFRSMLSSLIGACLLRVLFVSFIFPLNPTPAMLYICYPITWAITFIALLIMSLRFLHKALKSEKQSMSEY